MRRSFREGTIVNGATSHHFEAKDPVVNAFRKFRLDDAARAFALMVDNETKSKILGVKNDNAREITSDYNFLVVYFTPNKR